eukprot:Skav202064  [mRNA]  locus=scaffold1138:614770:619896:- [translate_table: standard]
MSAEKSLILRMTSADQHRPSVSECLADCWFSTMEDIALKTVKLSHSPLRQRFCKSNKLKKLAIHISASHLSAPEVLKMKDSRPTLMTSGGYRARAAIPEDVEKLMEVLDVDGSATISYPEFIAAMTAHDSVSLLLFKTFDRNGDGHINRNELQEALKTESFKAPAASLYELLQVLASDKDGDGTLDFQEFKAMMQDSASADVQKLSRDRANPKDKNGANNNGKP